MLQIITDWLLNNLPPGNDLYHDLTTAGAKHVSDLFKNLRPDIAVRTNSELLILELTICHETNFISSRNYTLDKYKNIQNNRTELSKHLPTTVYTCEVSTLGFLQIDGNFISKCGLHYPNGN